jgi:hypothetical protein
MNEAYKPTHLDVEPGGTTSVVEIFGVPERLGQNKGTAKG